MLTLRARLGIAVLTAIPVAVLVVFFLYPVASMVARGFWPDGSFAPGAVAEVLTRERTHRVLWFTVWSAGLATVLALVLGVPVAFALHRLRVPMAGVLRAVVLLPFVLPTVVVGVAFRQLIAASGPLGGLGLDGSSAAIVAALVFCNVSVVVRTVGAFWEGLDRRAEEAAAALGASPWRVFRDVTLPAVGPGIAAAATIVFLFCSTAFGIVLTMGGLRYANVETEIYQLTTQELDLSAAAALSLLQLVVIVVLLVLSGRVQRSAPALERAPLGPARPGVRHLPVLLWTGVVLVFLLLPIASLVLSSLRIGDGWGLASYRALGSHDDGGGALLVPVTTALGNSLWTAVQAAVLAMGLGLLVSGLLSRRPRTPARRRWMGALNGVVMLPLGVSAVTLGFGFLIALDRPPLDLRSSPWLVPIAQALVALPLVVRTLVPVLRSIDSRQREAAATLGAGPLRVLLAVDVPMARRAALAAAGFAFAVSLGEFGATSFVVREEHPTLPVVIYRLIGLPGQQHYGMAMAASVILAAATAAAVVAVERLRVPRVGAF